MRASFSSEPATLFGWLVNKLSGLIFISEIWRWEADSRPFARVFADFKLVRTDDSAVIWERRIQRAVPLPRPIWGSRTQILSKVVRELFVIKGDATPVAWFYSLVSVALASLLSLWASPSSPCEQRLNR
jgi:hypothetical protein